MSVLVDGLREKRVFVEEGGLLVVTLCAVSGCRGLQGQTFRLGGDSTGEGTFVDEVDVVENNRESVPARPVGEHDLQIVLKMTVVVPVPHLAAAGWAVDLQVVVRVVP
jgi:hypothetical protein